jgi:hypothetical protein
VGSFDHEIDANRPAEYLQHWATSTPQWHDHGDVAPVPWQSLPEVTLGITVTAPREAAACVEVRRDLAKARGLGTSILWSDWRPVDPDRKGEYDAEGVIRPVHPVPNRPIMEGGWMEA